MSLFSVLISFGRIPSASIRSGFLFPNCRFPSGGTGFPTNSPFTPAWDDLPFRSTSGTCRVSPLTTPWLAYPTRSPPCGSNENRTRPQPSITSNGRFKNGNTELIYFTYTMRWHWMLTWKTQTREKPREPIDSELSTIIWELQWQRSRQQPWALSLRQQAVTTKTRSVTNSLSHTLSRYIHIEYIESY